MTSAVLTGCTGSGKTTFGQLIAMEAAFPFVEEPESSNPFLTDSYLRPEIFGLRSQVSFMLGFLDAQLSWRGDVLQERCISDCLYVFSRILLHRQAISARDYKLLEQLHDRLIDLSPNTVDAFVFLECPVGVTLERITRRGREFETRIDEQFLLLQTEFYEEWLLNRVKLPVYRVSNEGSIDDLRQKAAAVAEFLRALKSAA